MFKFYCATQVRLPGRSAVGSVKPEETERITMADGLNGLIGHAEHPATSDGGIHVPQHVAATVELAGKQYLHIPHVGGTPWQQVLQ